MSASSPSGDPGTRASLLRNGGAAAGLVAVVALAFWGIGSFQDDGTPVAVDEPAADPAEDEQAEPEPEPEPEEEPEPEPEPEPEEEPDPEPEDEDEEDEPEPEEDADPDDDAEDDEPETPAVDPGSVTIQVLDGYKTDGGSAADQVASTLDGRGYQIIARNDAVNYDVTAVLYNPGNEAAAQQVASDIGGAEVRAQPGNLSTAVSLHVVVGADRG